MTGFFFLTFGMKGFLEFYRFGSRKCFSKMPQTFFCFFFNLNCRKYPRWALKDPKFKSDSFRENGSVSFSRIKKIIKRNGEKKWGKKRTNRRSLLYGTLRAQPGPLHLLHSSPDVDDDYDDHEIEDTTVSLAQQSLLALFSAFLTAYAASKLHSSCVKEHSFQPRFISRWSTFSFFSQSQPFFCPFSLDLSSLFIISTKFLYSDKKLKNKHRKLLRNSSRKKNTQIFFVLIF